GGLAALILAWFLFPGIMPVIVHFFDNRIAGAIERRDYPASPQPAQQPFWPEFWHDVRFALLAVGLNLLALPLYLFPPLNLLVFYGLNGYLLGREFFGMVARRHLAASQA